MRKTLIAILLAGGALSLTACHNDNPAPAPVTSAAPVMSLDQSLINRVRDKATDGGLDSISDEEIVALAHAACTDFDDGDSLDMVINDGISTGLPSFDIGLIIGGGISTYCPQYASLVPTS